MLNLKILSAKELFERIRSKKDLPEKQQEEDQELLRIRFEKSEKSRRSKRRNLNAKD